LPKELVLSKENLVLTEEIEGFIQKKITPLRHRGPRHLSKGVPGPDGLPCCVQGTTTTSPDCLFLQSRVEELTAENTRLREENTELRRRLALYENPNTPPAAGIPHAHALREEAGGSP